MAKRKTKTKADTMQVAGETGIQVIEESFLPEGTEPEQLEAELADAAANVQEQGEPNEHGVRRIGNGGNGAHSPQPTNQVIFDIDPENILIDSDLRALREWNGHSAHELSLPQLARTMYEEGQQYPVLMFNTDDGLVLYEGHRRREASVIIREEWDATWMLKAIVTEGMTKQRAIRMACLADSQHERFSPMQIARNIKFLRKQFNWVGGEHTASVADFLGVSPATITQMERLAKAPANVQADVESGRLSPTAALDLIALTANVPAEEVEKEQTRVVERAQVLANKEAEKKGKGKGSKDKAGDRPVPLTKEQAAIAKRAAESAKRDREKREAAKAHALDDAEQTTDPALLTDLTTDEPNAPEPTVPPTEPPAPAPITGKHVRQAARTVLTNPAPKAPKMGEAVELIEQWTGPAYPKVMGKWAETFAEWGRGKKSDKALEAAWDDIADELAKLEGKSGRKGTAPTKKATPPAKKTPSPTKKSAKPTRPVKKAAARAKKKK